MKNLTQKNKTTILFILGTIILLAIFLFFFIFKPKPPSQPLPPTEIYTKLIPTDLTVNIDLKDKDFLEGVDSVLNTQAGRIIEIKVIQDGKILNLEKVASLLKINIPDYVEDTITKKYTLIGFSSQSSENRRLGLILNVRQEENAVLESFKKWELSMANDLTSLFLSSKPFVYSKEISFKGTNYKGVKIRYYNFPDIESTAMDYALVDDKIIIATSRENIFAIIDLYQAIQARLKDCQYIAESCQDESCKYFSLCREEGKFEECQVYDCGEDYGLVITKKEGERPNRIIKTLPKERKIMTSEEIKDIRQRCQGKVEILEQKCESGELNLKTKVVTKGKCEIQSFIAKIDKEAFIFKFEKANDFYNLSLNFCPEKFEVIAVGEGGIAIK